MEKYRLLLFTLILCICVVTKSKAQSTFSPNTQNLPTAKYGYLHYDSILVNMPDYHSAIEKYNTLCKQYESEASYNEMAFKRQFAEFLQGQKSFTKAILLKRQKDLQDAMEKSLAYRHQADSILNNAKKELLAPVRYRLNKAIYETGIKNKYEYIVNLDKNTMPFILPNISEDATPYVLKELEQ